MLLCGICVAASMTLRADQEVLVKGQYPNIACQIKQVQTEDTNRIHYEWSEQNIQVR